MMVGSKHRTESKLKMSLAKKGRPLNSPTKFKHNKIPGRIEALPRGQKHWKWQDKPSYNAVHLWIAKVMGRPLLCSQCGFSSDNSRQFHWANVSGEYYRDVSDWIRLCCSCHFKMDNIAERSWITRRLKCA